MHYWIGPGIFLLGTATGALLTAIAYSGRIQRLRAEIESENVQHKKNDDEGDAKARAAGI
jgi:hypothetical protein